MNVLRQHLPPAREKITINETRRGIESEQRLLQHYHRPDELGGMSSLPHTGVGRQGEGNLAGQVARREMATRAPTCHHRSQRSMAQWKQQVRARGR